MPRESKKKQKALRKPNSSPKGQKAKVTAAANVNSNCSVQTRSNSLKEVSVLNNETGKARGQIKSKVILVQQTLGERDADENLNNPMPTDNVQSFQFEEDGEMVQMEVNDGEFTSEDETEESQESQSESESEGSVENNESDEEQEAGEISNDEESSTETEMQKGHGRQPSRTPSKGEELDSPNNRKRKNSAKRQTSVEDRLDTMSSTLLAMKELLVQQGIALPGRDSAKQQQSEKQLKRGESRGTQSIHTSESETTVYGNALKQMDREEIVDSEITFKVRNENENENTLPGKREDKRESSSLDEQIDTSDELIDVVGTDLDFCDKFIAECATGGKRRKMDDKEGSNPQGEAEEVIKNAEAAKIRMLTTPGNNFNYFEP